MSLIESLPRAGRPRLPRADGLIPWIVPLAIVLIWQAACVTGFVPVRVLPGITAAQAVASRVGAPLGHDYCVLSLSDRLKPWEVIAERLVAAARADLVIAVYNPASRTRTWQLAAARDLLLAHRAPNTPVVIEPPAAEEVTDETDAVNRLFGGTTGG